MTTRNPTLHRATPRGALSVPPRHRECARLIREQGWTYKQAGDHFGIARNTVMTWLARVDEAAADARNLARLA